MTTPQPRGMSRTLSLKFPIATTTLWGQLAGKTMTVHPRSLLLYCTAMFVYVYQTTTFPPHCGDNVKVKTQHIYQAMDIPVLLRGWGEAVVTNDWRIIYSPCEDPESFARGGQTLQRFFFVFFLMGGSKYHYISRPSSAASETPFKWRFASVPMITRH